MCSCFSITRNTKRFPIRVRNRSRFVKNGFNKRGIHKIDKRKEEERKRKKVKQRERKRFKTAQVISSTAEEIQTALGLRRRLTDLILQRLTEKNTAVNKRKMSCENDKSSDTSVILTGLRERIEGRGQEEGEKTVQHCFLNNTSLLFECRFPFRHRS